MRRLGLAAGFLLLLAMVALWRHDLVAEAARATLGQLSSGGRARAHVLFEIALFGAILVFSLRALAADFSPRRDLTLALFATLAGMFAETWGTRAGLWAYYTGEAPPLWILPAWTVGALVVERMGRALRSRLAGRLRERAQRLGFLLLAAVFLAVFARFTLPVSRSPVDALLLALLAAGMFFRAEAGDLWPMAAGIGLVFFADLWGTTNGCWRYHTQDSAGGLSSGILFGMFFDSAVVFLCVKATRRACPEESNGTQAAA